MIVKGSEVRIGQTWEFTETGTKYIVKEIEELSGYWCMAWLQYISNSVTAKTPQRFAMADESKWKLISDSPYLCVICKITEATNDDYICLDCDL